MAKLDRYFGMMKEVNASDLHMIAGAPPKLRILGELEPIAGEAVLTQEALADLLFEIVDAQQKAKFLQKKDLDFAYSLKGVARFRCNYFVQKLGYGAVFRIIPEKIKTIVELKLPRTVERFAHFQKGLALVTGPTGSGKSTTLAAIIDLINSTYNKHILTIEDPIEFVHQNSKCLIRQREVGQDTKSFANALRAALREDADVVLVGEMRDLETISLAITLAETGGLVLGTLHTNSVAKTIDRIIDVFPADQQEQIRTMLADSLKGIIAQQLLPTKDGQGRVAIVEILFGSAAVGNVIREGKTEQILSVMQGAKAEGMQTLDSELMAYIKQDVIGAEEAYMRAHDQKIFEPLLQQAFMEAASNGQTARILAMLKEGVTANTKDETGATAVMVSALNGHIEVVELLIESHADVNAKDLSGITALMRAAQKSHGDIVRILLQAGADVNAKNNGGHTALSNAVATGDLRIVQTLIRAGADVNSKDNLGSTVLIRTALGGNLKIVEALLAAGAAVDGKDRSERTALTYAVEKGNVALVELLIRAGADVNIKAKGEMTPIMWAAKSGTEIVQLLMSAGADVNARTPSGQSALKYAEEAKQTEVMDLLRSAGAN